MGVRHTIKLGRTGKNIEQRADIIKRKIALEIYRELIETTPVDTGRAKAGWNMGPMRQTTCRQRTSRATAMM